MGVVLRGHDRQTGRPVAIKTLRADVAERHPGALDRFQREAEMLRQLNHPNIIQVLATLEHEGTTYIVMEFAEGGSLAALLRRQPPLPLDRVLSIALDVADAMTRVHRLGILHRDLKPENVLLAADGTARLSDFGIAYLIGGATRLTQEAGVFGTPQYLSPEALRGKSLDARTDIWAFGVVLFEMLTGRPPFTGNLMAAIVQSVLNDRVPDLEDLRPDAPAALLDLVYRMLEKDPGTRIRSVRLVGAELETLLHRSDQAQTMLGAAIPDLDPPAEPTNSFASSSTPSSTGRLHNIPAQTTPFVGRQEELPALARLVNDPAVRMITVLGTGGSGKTRVAQEVAIRNVAEFPDGAFFVPLAPLREAEHIVTTIGESIGLAFKPGIPQLHQLAAHLADKHILLLLDNFEHLLNGAGAVSDILNAAARVTILATSRERLGLQEETVFRLDGIDVPPPDAPIETLASFSAVELFLQSARRTSPAYAPRNGDLSAIAAICRAVGGSPLAILLAASWVEVVSPPEILQEIRRSLDFLETDLRHVEQRHRSMRVVFDASWQRLSDEEREQFAQMAVFRGGFTREAAQEVTGASLRTLSNLVRLSLLQRDPATGRYDMHELLRQYAEGRLAATPNAHDDAAGRHAAYYAAFLHRLEAGLLGADKHKGLAQIEREIDNVRAAWDFAVAHGNLPVIGQALTSMATYYGLRTLNEEAVARLGAALDVVRALPESGRPLELELGLQVRATVALMNLKSYGDPGVGAGFTRAHELCNQLGPSRMIAPVMFGLWAFNIISAHHARAKGLAQQLLQIGESSSDPVLEIGGHHASAGSSVSSANLEQAIAHAERVLQLYRPEYDPLIITFFADHSASASRGWYIAALTALGHLDRAQQVAREMRAFFEQLGHGQTHAQGLMFLFLHATICRDYVKAEELGRDMKRAGEQYGLPAYVVFGEFFLQCTTMDPVLIAQATHAVRDMFGFKCMTIGLSVIRLAHAQLAAGDTKAALAAVESGLEWLRTQEEYYFEPEILRTRGDVLCAIGDLAAAEEDYEAAVSVARSHNARLFELRATMGLSRVWQHQNRAADAVSALRPVYEWFTEGLDTIDLRDARALLDELSARV
jgi:serine/threonine protein kinase/predicted ATPase